VNSIMQWGLAVIHAIQRVHGPVLDAFFKGVTALGSEDFYFLLLPLLVWCIHFGTGVRLAAVLLLSTFINTGLKDLFALPRPFELDPSVRLYEVEGYGMPSAHAQLSAVIWGTLARAVRKTWAWGLAAVLALLIGFSRIYLGVHFPTDVLAGWFIGGLLLTGYVAFQPRVEAWLAERELGTQLTLVVGLPLVLSLLHWTEETASLMGVLLGAGVALVLLRRYADYDVGGPLWKRGLRLLLGGIVMLALRFGLKWLFRASPESLRLAFRFVRYAVLGLWIGLGAPLVFNKLGLSNGEGASA